jgi:hypothetical protein
MQLTKEQIEWLEKGNDNEIRAITCEKIQKLLNQSNEGEIASAQILDEIPVILKELQEVLDKHYPKN